MSGVWIMSAHSERNWRTAPISPTCETLVGACLTKSCGQPTTHAYPALRGGWAALCEHHADNIHPYCILLADLLTQGETMAVTS
jgi:hypothetical protein